MSDSMPILQFQIRNLEHEITTAFAAHGDEINKYVAESMARELSEDRVKQKVDEAIKKAVDKAIDDLTTNYRLSKLLGDLIIDQLSSQT